MPRAVALVTAGALLLPVAGCAGSTDRPATAVPATAVPATASEGVTASVLQYRSDQTLRRVQIKVRNDGPAAVTVLAAELGSPRFTDGAAWAGPGTGPAVVIAPGTATDLPAPLGPAGCPAAAAGAAEAVARLELAGPEGGAAQVRVPAPDPFDVLRKVQVEDCLRADAARIATLEVVGPVRVRPAAGGPIGLVDLRATPTGAPGRLELVGVGVTTLLAAASGRSGWPVGRAVDAASGPVGTTLELRPARCDAHAIADDKLGTVLPVTVRVDGVEGLLPVPAPVAVRDRLYAFVTDACAGR